MELSGVYRGKELRECQCRQTDIGREGTHHPRGAGVDARRAAGGVADEHHEEHRGNLGDDDGRLTHFGRYWMRRGRRLMA